MGVSSTAPGKWLRNVAPSRGRLKFEFGIGNRAHFRQVQTFEFGFGGSALANQKIQYPGEHEAKSEDETGGGVLAGGWWRALAPRKAARNKEWQSTRPADILAENVSMPSSRFTPSSRWPSS
jgi:hypothetical protein